MESDKRTPLLLLKSASRASGEERERKEDRTTDAASPTEACERGTRAARLAIVSLQRIRTREEQETRCEGRRRQREGEKDSREMSDGCCSDAHLPVAHSLSASLLLPLFPPRESLFADSLRCCCCCRCCSQAAGSQRVIGLLNRLLKKKLISKKHTQTHERTKDRDTKHPPHDHLR